jgi:glycerol-3-phosphate acyltransferase PlsY
MAPIFTTAAIAYVLGSIPFGYLLVRIFLGADVRTTGSGNIGATNVARTSPALGVATLAFDAVKGLAAVWLALHFFPYAPELAFLAAFSAICGHIFPVWLRFRGGKGVATGLGSFLLLTPKAILVAFVVFLITAAAFRYVSVASIMAAASLPLFSVLLREAATPLEFVFVFLGSLLIVVKHQKNIRRLVQGVEPKFELRRK